MMAPKAIENENFHLLEFITNNYDFDTNEQIIDEKGTTIFHDIDHNQFGDPIVEYAFLTELENDFNVTPTVDVNNNDITQLSQENLHYLQSLFHEDYEINDATTKIALQTDEYLLQHTIEQVKELTKDIIEGIPHDDAEQAQIEDQKVPNVEGNDTQAGIPNNGTYISTLLLNQEKSREHDTEQDNACEYNDAQYNEILHHIVDDNLSWEQCDKVHKMHKAFKSDVDFDEALQAHYDEYTGQQEQMNSPSQVTHIFRNTYITGRDSNVTYIKGIPYQTMKLTDKGQCQAEYHTGHKLTVIIDNGATISIMPYVAYKKAEFLHGLHKTPAQDVHISTGNGTINSHFFITIIIQIQGIVLQIRVLVCDSTAYTDILLGRDALTELHAIHDYIDHSLHVKQTTVPMILAKDIKVPPQTVTYATLLLQVTKTAFQLTETIQGTVLIWKIPSTPDDTFKPARLPIADSQAFITLRNRHAEDTAVLPAGSIMAYLDIRELYPIPTNLADTYNYYRHNIITTPIDDIPLAEEPLTCDQPSLLISRKPLPLYQKHIKKHHDQFPWLDENDKRRTMTDREIIEDRINLDNSVLTATQKQHFYSFIEDNRDVFSLRDEIGTCPYIQVKLKLRDETPFFVRPYPIKEEQKSVVQREMNRLEKLGIIKKGLTGYSSPVLLVKRKQQNLYRVVTDFRVLNDKMVRINHAFPLVKDCIEAMGRTKCDILSVIDLRDAYHTLRLHPESMKYCGITPYYGSATYHYLRMGMGISASPAIWQQFVDHIMQFLKEKEHYKIIMDDALIYSQLNDHRTHLQDLFNVLERFGLKISAHKCQFYRDSIIYMGMRFLIDNGHVCYTALRDKCEAINALKPPKTVKEVRTFCGMINFLAVFLKDVRRLLVPIYKLTRKDTPFVWTEECEQSFEQIKDLCKKPPILHVPVPNAKYRLESDTSVIATGGVLYQYQNDKWVLIGFHSKRLPDAVRNYGIAELELCGLIANIHGFIQLLKNNYFEILVDHKTIEFLKKAKHEPTTRRLTMMLLKLHDYSFDLKYLKGQNMILSDALSRLYKDEKHRIQDIIPLNFLQHLDPVFVHKHCEHMINLTNVQRRNKAVNTNKQINRPKRGRPPKDKGNNVQNVTHPAKQTQKASTNQLVPVNAVTKTPRNNTQVRDKNARVPNNNPGNIPLPQPQTDVSDMIPIYERQRDRGNKEIADYNPDSDDRYRTQDAAVYQPCTNIIPLKENSTVTRAHIPQQSEIDNLLRNIKMKVLHSIAIPIQYAELVTEYATSPLYGPIYKYITEGRLSGNLNQQRKLMMESQSYVTVDNILCRIQVITHKTHKDASLLVVIPPKFEPQIFHAYHNAILASHQGAWRTFLTLRQLFYMPNMLNKLRKYIQACDICQRTGHAPQRPHFAYARIPDNYKPMAGISADIKHMPRGIADYHFLLLVTCEFTNFVVAVPLTNIKAETIAEALVHRVITIFGIPELLIVDKAKELTGEVIKILLHALQCTHKVISPYNHGSLKTERQIQTIGNMITKHLVNKGAKWPLYASICAYAMNTFSSEALDGYSPYELVFARKPPDLTKISILPFTEKESKYFDYVRLLRERAQIIVEMFVEWKALQNQQKAEHANQLQASRTFNPGDLVYLLAPHASSLQTGTRKFRQDYVGPLVVKQTLDMTHYLLEDLIGRTLPDTYHINRLKRALVPTRCGQASNIKQLRTAGAIPQIKPSSLPAITANNHHEVSSTLPLINYLANFWTSAA